jgi:hypothetical protein
VFNSASRMADLIPSFCSFVKKFLASMGAS